MHIVIDGRIRRASTGRPVDRLIHYIQAIDQANRYTILIEPDDPLELTNPNFSTLAIPYKQFSFNPLQQILFSSLLYRLKPDLVHFTLTGQAPLFYFGRQTTFTHDLTMFRFVRRGNTALLVYKLKLALYRLLVWSGHVRARWIIVPTHFVAQDVAGWQPSTKNKLVVTHEAGELPRTDTTTKPEHVGEEDTFIMYLGTAFPHKNLEKLVEAFDILNAKYPDLRLVLVGKKEKHYEELEQKIQGHPSAKNVLITGFLPDEQTKWLYAHAQAYVFPSLSEGWGLPPLEAMANGAAVAASNASCIPEVLGDAAHYFDATNPEDIAAKVSEVLDNPELRANLKAKGQAQFKKYSWERFAEENYAVFKQVLGL